MKTAPDIDTAIEWAKAGQPSMAQCPAHDDGHASLSVGPGSEQPVLLKCHAGCDTSDIIAAAGIDWDEVCEHRDDHRAEGNVWTPSGPASHVYPYLDEEGRELFQTLRIPLAGGGKTFSQRHASPSEKSGWAWNLTGVRRVPYRLPQIIRAVADGQTIVIVEGEKDADRAVADGYAATCCPMGAGKWQTTYGEFLKGAEVIIVADADDAGRAHALAVYDDLVDNHGCRVKIVQSSIAKDYTAHRQRGGTFDSLSVKKASYFTGSDMSGMGIQDFLTEDFPEGKVIIPGMLAEANVFVLVGPEGHGKTTLLRQIAVQCAAGIRPFTGGDMEPLRVLYLDAENPEHQQQIDWRRLAGLAARNTGSPVPNDNLWIMSEWRSEPDLTTIDGQHLLYEAIANYRPHLCLMGPVQNLVGRDVKDDEVVRKFKHAINTARSICGTAFGIEHHAPHRAPGDKERQMRPYGSSLFMKWPDFGYGLKPTEEEDVYDLYPFRRPRVRSRAWPERLRWGKPNTLEFPWEEAEPESATIFHPRFGG